MADDSRMMGQVEQAALAVQRICNDRPRIGLILGTGLGDLSDDFDAAVSVAYEEIPHFARSTAPGHKGHFVYGRLAQVPVIAMRGRLHLYEGYSLDQIVLPLRVMRHLGAELLVVSNASGGLNPSYASGGIMVINSHINFMWNDHGGAGLFPSRSPLCRENPYDETLIQQALAIARQENFAAYEGVYVAVAGPNYETRAEYRFFRKIGGDVVGMSTVPEVLIARQLGMRVLGLSTVTNLATPDTPVKTEAEDVVAMARQAGSKLRKIVSTIIEKESLGDESKPCPTTKSTE